MAFTLCHDTFFFFLNSSHMEEYEAQGEPIDDASTVEREPNGNDYINLHTFVYESDAPGYFPTDTSAFHSNLDEFVVNFRNAMSGRSEIT